jgi:small-conductance mechanosensitive channel
MGKKSFYQVIRSIPIIVEEPKFDPAKQDLNLENGHKAYVYRLEGKLHFKHDDTKSKSSFKRAIRKFCEEFGLQISQWQRTPSNNVVAVC